MSGARLRRPDALLTQHFLRQFLESDLISPEADRTQLISVVGAMALCLTLFISVFMSANYVVAVFTPAEAAVRSLDDKFFYLALAMIVAALVAAAQWDALAIDPRDAAILEPLPVEAGIVRRAKLTAVAILGAAVAIALNMLPSVIFPWLLVFNFPQLSVTRLPVLMAAHAVVTIAAAGFGYLAVVTLREWLAALLGIKWFTRVSPWAQGVLIVVLGSMLLLMPREVDNVGRRGFDGWRAQSPPMWFLGAYEAAVGGIIADLPRREMNPRQATRDHNATVLYDGRRGQFPALAARALNAYLVLAALAAVAYLWNARRLPSLAPSPPPAFRRRWRLAERVVNSVLVAAPAAQAGFYFSLAALWRSNAHRLTLACAAAAGVAMAIVAWSGVRPAGTVPVRALAMQPLLYGALLVGFRHVIRVPAELRANWGFQLAWRNRERAYLYGARCAAIVALALPAILVLLPFYAVILGPSTALVHAAWGLGGAIVLLEVMLVFYDKVPFTCSYVPSENMKALAPIYALLFIIGAVQFARLQHGALFGGRVISGAVTLAVVFAIARVISITRVRMPQVEFDEAPATYQRLGLHS